MNWFNIAINLTESFLMILFVKNFLTMNEKYNILVFSFFVTVSFLLITFLNMIIPYEGILMFLEIALLLLFGILYAKNNFIEKLLVSVMTFLLMSMVNSSVIIIMSYACYGHLDFKALVNGELRYYFILSLKLIYALVSQGLAHLRKRYSYETDKADMFGLTVLVVISAIIFVGLEWLLLEDSKKDFYLSLSIISLVVMDFLLIVIFMKLQQYQKNQIENELRIAVLQRQITDKKELLSVYRETAKLRHDMRHILDYVESCMMNKQYKEALLFLHKYQNNIDQTKGMILIPNQDILTYIISAKKAKAVSNNVDFTCQISISQPLSISDVELTVLLGNALDNAIEHCSGDKKVRINITEQGKMCIIAIQNSIAKSVLSDNAQLTTSNDKKQHGYGVASMKEIVYKYHGEIRYMEQDHYFICTIFLPFSA